MALHKGFGTLLRDARVSQGLSYSTVSRKLKIRPDILEAIENEDFSKMPPKSYSRGMIHAYATLLHLNPQTLCEDYLAREEELNQPSRDYHDSAARSSRGRADRRASSGLEPYPSNAQRTPESSRRASRSSREDRSDRGSARNPSLTEHKRSGRRTPNPDSSHEPREHDGFARITPEISYDARSHNGRFTSRDGKNNDSTGRRRVQSADLSASRGLSFRKPKVDINHSIYADTKGQGRMHGGRLNGSKASYLSGGNFVGSFDSAQPNHSTKKIIIAVIVVIIVLILLINGIGALVSGGSKNSSSSSTSASMAISGLNDPGTASTSVVQETPKVVAVAPTATVITYEVKSGEEAYIEIYLNDSGAAEVASTLYGPASGTYDVTGTLEFVTTNPDGVTLKQDGSEVALTDDNSDGVYIYDVNFADVLAAWKAENGQS